MDRQLRLGAAALAVSLTGGLVRFGSVAFSMPLGLIFGRRGEDYGLLAGLDRDGMLKIAIVADKKIKPPTTPKGGEMFEEEMRAFGPNVKGIRGNWVGTGTMTENFDSFKAALKSGLSPEDAA